jgi:hypothetical protein
MICEWFSASLTGKLLKSRTRDKVSQDQIDVYAARGILIESELAWLWGTASEHAVFYQYQIAKASNIFMGMIQTESPYFQPTPPSPQPFRTGLFTSDPDFQNCKPGDVKCAVSWAVRIIDSSTVYILGAGLYSWFSKYNQDCLRTEDCQSRGLEVQQSGDLWIYNLCTKAIVEMVSPLGAVPTFARDNMNGFLSSVLAWLQGSIAVSGKRNFKGFQIFIPDDLRTSSLPASCKTALTNSIFCDGRVQRFGEPAYHGSLPDTNTTDSVCDIGCSQSLGSWVTGVRSACQGYNVSNANPILLGARMQAAVNETCLKDQDGRRYCNGEETSLRVVALTRLLI